MLRTLKDDLIAKAQWYFEKAELREVIRIFFSDGTTEMVIYRLMWASNKLGLFPLTFFFAWFNGFFNKIVIGRKADFGPGFVILHGCATVINSAVQGGANIVIENGVTLGAEKGKSPKLGNSIFIGAGAKIIGAITIGNNVKIGANAVVTKDVPNDCTVAGIPARIIKRNGRRVDEPLV